MAATAEELSSVLILYTKFFTVCSIFWRFGFWYSCLYAIGWIGNLIMLSCDYAFTDQYCIVLSTIFPQPWYRGPTKIYELNEAAFRDKVLHTAKPKPSSLTSTISTGEIKGPRITELDENGEPKEDKEDKEEKKLELEAKYWIVMLYANWSVACLNFEAVLAKLSIQYDVPHLKFGNVEYS